MFVHMIEVALSVARVMPILNKRTRSSHDKVFAWRLFKL